MATKNELLAYLKEEYGSVMNATKVTKAIGLEDRKSAVSLLEEAGVPYYKIGRQRMYHAIDIAKYLTACKVEAI